MHFSTKEMNKKDILKCKFNFQEEDWETESFSKPTSAHSTTLYQPSSHHSSQNTTQPQSLLSTQISAPANLANQSFTLPPPYLQYNQV